MHGEVVQHLKLKPHLVNCLTTLALVYRIWHMQCMQKLLQLFLFFQSLGDRCSVIEDFCLHLCVCLGVFALLHEGVKLCVSTWAEQTGLGWEATAAKWAPLTLLLFGSFCRYLSSPSLSVNDQINIIIVMKSYCYLITRRKGKWWNIQGKATQTGMSLKSDTLCNCWATVWITRWAKGF